jgi:murein DD-endopeptidase MepM/ murein hydrolase activator NlpD
MIRFRIDSMTIVSAALLAFMGFNVLSDRGVFAAPPAPEGVVEPTVEPAAALTQEPPLAADTGQGGAQEAPPAEIDADAITWPYEAFAVTQGPHGFSYGHMAVDITAGKEAPIQSPINGMVTALFIDEWGNPSLIIENARYKIEMLHGNFSVHTGEMVSLGQQVGTESNQGNTVDATGRSCRGRDCGYHTHLNVFDKILGANLNPLEVIGE